MSPSERTDDVDEDHVEDLKSCAGLYRQLEECLVATNRDFGACQKEVLALKQCYLQLDQKETISSAPMVGVPSSRTSGQGTTPAAQE
eukprot:jgi/Botrbrau1/7481/Bobra.0095s0019.1